MKSKRMKVFPLGDRADFTATVDELAVLETKKREIEAERDLEIQQVTLRFAERLAPIVERIKGKLALAEAYADEHRAELLPKDAKSVPTDLARYGWRTGNRTVKLMSKVTEENAINALEALGLTAYIRTEKAIAKDLILADCGDDKTLTFLLGGDRVAGFVEKTVALSDAGLKIAQSEAFFVEPTSEAAETLKTAAA